MAAHRPPFCGDLRSKGDTTIFLTILATIALTVVVMNFMTGEKKNSKAISPRWPRTNPVRRRKQHDGF